MDPNYTPPDIETRQVYGISMQQKRNDAVIDASLFKNIVTKNKEVSVLENAFFQDQKEGILMLATRICRYRLDRRYPRSQVHSVQLGLLRPQRNRHRSGSRSTISNPLHSTRR